MEMFIILGLRAAGNALPCRFSGMDSGVRLT